MSQSIINVGTYPNSGTGDDLRTAFIKANANFTELYGYIGSSGTPLIETSIITADVESDLPNSRALAVGYGLDLTDTGPGGSLTIKVVDKGIAPGTYTNSTITIDSHGHVSNVSTGPGSGYTGSRGNDGYTGSHGPFGYTGSVGPIGPSGGYAGSIGYTGSVGAYSAIGFTGSQGYTGSIGYTGSVGDYGGLGYTGSQGDVGYTGSIGYTGSRGIQGYTGSQGIQGYTGSIGYTGSQGITGYTGSLGTTGYTGSIGVTGYAGSLGTTGYTGSIGYTGSQGYSGSIGYSSSQATAINITDNIATNSTYYIPFVGGTGYQSEFIDSTNLIYNPSTNTLTSSVFSGTATTAKYADLAEIYASDKIYPIGTLLSIGGINEVTASTHYAQRSIIGVVSEKPAYLMNSVYDPEFPIKIGLTGRLPIRIIGRINKGDLITSSDVPGVACKLDISDFTPGCIIGKSLETKTSDNEAMIEIIIGRY